MGAAGTAWRCEGGRLVPQGSGNLAGGETGPWDIGRWGIQLSLAPRQTFILESFGPWGLSPSLGREPLNQAVQSLEPWTPLWVEFGETGLFSQMVKSPQGLAWGR